MVGLRHLLKKNAYVLRDVDGQISLAETNKVNINGWFDTNRDVQNVGDYLSQIVVSEVASYYGIDMQKTVSKTKHLYAVGSILMGYQDATVWGSGFLNDNTAHQWFKAYSFIHRHWHTTDVRAVRGPETRNILLKMGIECPEVYGDPAILMPLFYTPVIKEPRSSYLVVPHYSSSNAYDTADEIAYPFNADYKKFINCICSTNLVISSSLHGIILAEAYGIPAVMLHEGGRDIFKYKDYYHSTGRTDFSIARTVEEAKRMNPLLPDTDRLKEMRQRLLDVFPKDLWEE